MNSGIVRHIDTLGRIVIPKEIRKMLHIENGDPLEISLSGKTIIVERYSQIPDLKEQIETFLKVAARELNMAAAICSLDTAIFYRGVSLSGNTLLSSKLQQAIRTQTIYHYNPENCLYLTDSEVFPINALYPIGTVSKPAGAFALIRIMDTDATQIQTESANIIAKILTELIRS